MTRLRYCSLFFGFCFALSVRLFFGWCLEFRLGLQPDGWRVFYSPVYRGKLSSLLSFQSYPSGEGNLFFKPIIPVHPLDGGEFDSAIQSAELYTGASPRWRGIAYSAVNSKQTFLSCLFGSPTTAPAWRYSGASGGPGHASDVSQCPAFVRFCQLCAWLLQSSTAAIVHCCNRPVAGRCYQTSPHARVRARGENTRRLLDFAVWRAHQCYFKACQLCRWFEFYSCRYCDVCRSVASCARIFAAVRCEAPPAAVCAGQD